MVNWDKTIGNPQATMTQFANLRQLQGLAPATVDVRARTVTPSGHGAPAPGGADTTTTVTITNTSSKPTVAFFLRADIRRGSASGTPAPGDNEVLPVFWSDNDVTLWPGESETLRASYRRADLRGASPVVSVSAWNVATQRRGGTMINAPASDVALDQLLELTFQPLAADVALLHRQPDPRCRPLGGGAGRRRGALGEPQHARVVAEVVLAQLGVAVEPELAHHRALESPREEVGEEVRARLLGQRLPNLVTREHVVAVLAGEPRDPGAGEHRVDRAVGAAVAVGDGDRVVVVAQPLR